MSRKEVNRQKAIDATLALCLKHSFHGTSMDSITAATGMSKATIYRHFDSKEKLIAEALEFYRQQSTEVLTTLFQDPALSLQEKLSARFVMLKESFDSQEFQGCYFQKAHNEYCNEEPAISGVCSLYKIERTQMIAELLLAHDIVNAKEKAKRAELVFNGLLASLLVNSDRSLIDLAQQMYFEQLEIAL